MKVRTFADLMAGHETAEILCAVHGEVVRRLRVAGGHVEVTPLEGPSITVPSWTPITYEPWFMDRGSMLFQAEGGQAKICTEGDLVRFPDGVEDRVEN